jgi:hypothetical protein
MDLHRSLGSYARGLINPLANEPLRNAETASEFSLTQAMDGVE